MRYIAAAQHRHRPPGAAVSPSSAAAKPLVALTGATGFIFLSSIRAQCGPSAEQVLTEDMPPQPTDAYGRSKLAAEQGLKELDLDWAALRLVLVYGTGVKGNMAQLLRFARMPYPL